MRSLSARQWAGLALLTLPALLVAVDFSVLNLAVPAIARSLRPSSATLLWIVDGYGLLLAAFLVPMGVLGDRIGRRRLLLIGAAVFGLGSVAAASADSAGTLVVARSLLGIAAATLAPSTLSLISTLFPDERQRTFAIAVWGAALSSGGALGPVVGGLLLARFWWGSVFWLAVPIMAALLAAGPWVLPEFRDPAPRRVDLLSVALSLGTVLAIAYGVQQAAEDGLTPLNLAAVVVGAALGVLLIRRQRSLSNPLIDLRVFRIPVVGVALAANTVSFFVVLGLLLLVAQYLQLVLGLSPLLAGLWTVPSMLALVLGDLATPRLTARFGRVAVLAGGLMCAALGSAILASVLVAGGLAQVLAGTVVLSLGIAPVSTVVADLVVGAVPTAQSGAAAGLSETTTELGGALGVAVLGSIATVIYRFGTASLPEGARDSLGGAVSLHLTRAVLDTARASFTTGLGVAALVATVLLATLGPFALRQRG